MAGLVGQYPVGGVAFDYLQYVLGLEDLGHDVYYHEDTWSWPYNPVIRAVTADPTYSTTFLDAFFARFAPSLRSKWHYVNRHETHHGMTEERFSAVVRTADLFLNISGASIIPVGLPETCTTVFLDTDPGYNQIVMVTRPAWSDNVDRWIESVYVHDRHATYAENLGSRGCRVPDAGLSWIHTRMPIVRRLWEPLSGACTTPANDRWSTVMTWNAFKGPLTLDGVEYGSKGTAFESIIDLPRRTDAQLTLALGGRDAPVERIRSHGWHVIDAPTATCTPDDYLSFIGGSCGELSIAKHVYAALRTGWFSCRTACYLAAGRPAIVQDTGLSNNLPTGIGLLTFDDADGAAAALEAVCGDYRTHAAAAFELAQAHFDAPSVLLRLLEDVGAAPSSA